MPPRSRSTARATRPAAASLPDASLFPTWDELVAEAHIDKTPYQLPLPDITEVDPETKRKKVIQKACTIEIGTPSGQAYITISQAQRAGDASTILFTLVPKMEDRLKLLRALPGADFPIMDVIATKVLRYFYGVNLAPAAVPDPNDSGDDTDEPGDTAGK